ARKAIAGQIFPKLFIFIFYQIKMRAQINLDYFITDKPNLIKEYRKSFLINVDGETQKPDCDLLLYNLEKSEFIIFSLKTSLRERIGQTYKWKLLMEIASSENNIKQKYNIQYNPKIIPLICFATVNFYNEINNPQHRGMFKFFDKSFIGKPIDTKFISSLSNLVSYINALL
ncbi:MAG: BsaWI family type II restriction enzyme, partial [Sediminibacterium sp.]|nr:BsaWI family type II restriction enzyme [Sediminibacterium sp.]